MDTIAFACGTMDFATNPFECLQEGMNHICTLVNGKEDLVIPLY